MDYNEYNGNGNRNKFNLSDLFTDKTQRSRLLLFVYLLIFIVLIIFVRINLRNNLSNNNANQNTNKNVTNDNLNTSNDNYSISKEINEMFSFIDSNNYNFVYEMKINDTNSISKGKRYDNKYNFELNSADSTLYFKGTTSNIKATTTFDGHYENADYPYVLVNVYDNNIIKRIINSSKLEEDKYLISNEEIGKLLNKNLLNGELINSIELVKNNKKVTAVILDLSNAVSSYLNENTTAIFTLNYSNFGLIDDFDIE